MSNLIALVNDLHVEPASTVKMWENSIFRHLAVAHPKTKGTRFEAIARDILKKMNYKVQDRESVSHDCIIDGSKTEIKGSMLNTGTGNFSFLQIRPQDDYDQIVFLCFRPDRLTVYSMSKEGILNAIKEGHLRKQHGGKRGDGITYCLYTTETQLEALGAIPYVQETHTNNSETV